ncbi:fungal-specific transcription factor domain-domain-containing protein [Leucosporidium creatinivorum]|uniref:Fungal-specific transcription factor domain-domain-containing protein n=1 Tax=Leucosporidium creatinivorum TaxID=106004 RepID=A0A1Y2G0H5_9BASI|nr:fungal-specific transcription factor domain-domain-containing protein [Leucosporidium creatinivorum]
MSQERPAETSKGKVKAKAKAKAASTSQGNPGDASVELKLPTFIPPEGALKSRAPGRKSVACRGCRSRKIRCDGSRPSCMSCQVIYRQECHYDVVPSAVDAAQVVKELAELRALLGSLLISNHEDRDRLLSIYSTQQQESPASAATASTPSLAGPSSAPTSGAEAVGGIRTVKRPAEAGPDDDSRSQEDERAAALLSELSFAASGQVEHFGATSFLHQPMLGSSVSPPVLPDLGSPSAGEKARLGTLVRNVPSDLRNHLLDIFWLWQSVHCFVYKPALLRDLDGGPFCNDFLINVIFAHAARFSNRNDVRTSSSDMQTAGGVFLARAKELLGSESDKPSSVPTAQGLLILGGRECACGNHSQGFLYTAMGLSMAIDLGVHLDGTKVYGAQHHDPLEVEVRKRLFWSCYVWDKSISLCLGRAPRFLKGDSSFRPPAEFDKSEDDFPWLPQFSEMPSDLKNYPFFSFRSGAYFEKSCKLSEIIEDILLELYAGKRRENTEQSLMRYNKLLEDWRATLHPDLVIAADAVVSPPPNCVTLNMLFNACVILANRPFAFTGWGPRIIGSEAQCADSKARCRKAANEIARLLGLYASTFQFRNMNWLMGYTSYTAATILVFDVRAPDPTAAQSASQHLEVILESLSSQTSITPSVQRSIEIIQHLLTNTPPASGTTTPRFPTAKRPRADHTNDTDQPALPSWTFDAGDHGEGAHADGTEPAAFGDHSALQFTDFLNVAYDSAPLPSMDMAFVPPLLPAFPESGPLSWLGAAQDEDWLQGFDWLQQGDNGHQG